MCTHRYVEVTADERGRRVSARIILQEIPLVVCPVIRETQASNEPAREEGQRKEHISHLE